MSSDVRLDHNTRLPDNSQDAITMLGQLSDSVEMVSSITYWMMGRVLVHMKDTLGVDNPKAEVARALQQSDRLLGYCMTVHRAYTWEELQRVAAKLRLKWTLIRELASPRLEGHRDNLIDRLESGEFTEEEVATQVARLQANVRGDDVGELTDGTTSDDIDVKFRRMVSKLGRDARKLTSDLETAVKEFRGDGLLLDAMLDDEGCVDDAMEGIVVEIIGALQTVITDSIDGVYYASLAIGNGSWPFEAAEAKLAEHGAAYDEDGELLDGLEGDDEVAVEEEDDVEAGTVAV